MKIHKAILLILALAGSFLINNELLAQRGRGPHFERIRVQRIAFFTEKLGLTTEEAEAFWPVYNEYSEKKNNLSQKRRDLSLSIIDQNEAINEEKAENNLRQYVAYQEKEHDLFMEYHQKFKAILPDEKVLKLYIAELQFKQFLLNEIRGGGRHGWRQN